MKQFDHSLAHSMVLAMRKAEAAWGHGLSLDFRVKDPTKHRVMLIAALLEAADAVDPDEPSGHIKVALEKESGSRDFKMNASVEPPPGMLADRAKLAIAAAAARSLLALLEGDSE